ncbi:MAG TPA: PEP-CTERM sorting domain-containing protein [Phycisphaerae bacterium]|nr:PEP-CTERM sorting domain-containing protein [Phycisphaerae bacterium]
MKATAILASVLAIGLAWSTAGATVVYTNTFSSAADYVTTAGPGQNWSGTSNLSWSNTAGVGGTNGKLSVGSSGSYVNSLAGTYQMAAVGDWIEVSVMVLGRGLSSTSRDTALVTLSGDSSYVYGSASGQYSVMARVGTDSSATEESLQFRLYAGTASPTTVTSANFSLLTADVWYKLTMKVTRNADNTLNYVTSIQNYGSNGQTPGSVVSSLSGTTAVTSLSTDSTISAGMGARKGNANGLDNFQVSVVPEPATAALVALGGGLALLRRRH